MKWVVLSYCDSVFDVTSWRDRSDRVTLHQLHTDSISLQYTDYCGGLSLVLSRTHSNLELWAVMVRRPFKKSGFGF